MATNHRSVTNKHHKNNDMTQQFGVTMIQSEHHNTTGVCWSVTILDKMSKKSRVMHRPVQRLLE